MAFFDRFFVRLPPNLGGNCPVVNNVATLFDLPFVRRDRITGVEDDIVGFGGGFDVLNCGVGFGVGFGGNVLINLLYPLINF